MVSVLLRLGALLVPVSAASPPHLVLILGDDVGSYDVGYNDPTVQTPELDSLAKDGVRMSNMYTWCWCAPSRGALLTGRYAPKLGWNAGGEPANSKGSEIPVMPRNVTMLPAVLKSASTPYKTIMAGKWHLGFARPLDLPENRGFDEYFGYLSGGEDYYAHTTTVNPSECKDQTDLWYGTATGGGGPVTNRTYFDEGHYSTGIYAKFLSKAIKAHDPTTPLFVYAAFQGIHYPLEVPKRFFDLYADEAAAAGCDWDAQKTSPRSGRPNGFDCEPNMKYPKLGKVGLNCVCNRILVKAQSSALSDGIGQIVDALKANGMYNNSVIVFQGDNGGPLDGAHSNGPLRGGKLNFWEGGVRTAAFVHSPLLPAGARGAWFDGIAHEVDWLSTFARLAGANPPSDVDSHDLWGALSAPTDTLNPGRRNETLIAQYILRSGRWKLVAGAEDSDEQAWKEGMLKGCMIGTYGGWGVSPPNSSHNTCPISIYTKGTGNNGARLGCPDDAPKKTKFPVSDPVDLWLCSAACTPSSPCLYDLEKDPFEHNDVASANPTVVADLSARLRAIQADFRNLTYITDDGSFCQVANARGNYTGPWLHDNVRTVSHG